VVVADGNFIGAPNCYPFVRPAGGSWSINYPAIILVDQGMVISSMSEPSPSQIEAALNN
jgi:hypothetical protein